MMQDLITTIAALEIMHLDNANNPFPLSMESQYKGATSSLFMLSK
jgi:hypothetical protein